MNHRAGTGIAKQNNGGDDEVSHSHFKALAQGRQIHLEQASEESKK